MGSLTPTQFFNVLEKFVLGQSWRWGWVVSGKKTPPHTQLEMELQRRNLQWNAYFLPFPPNPSRPNYPSPAWGLHPQCVKKRDQDRR